MNAYREILAPVDNSAHCGWAVERAIEIASESDARITATHVYAARLHDVRFRQLETGLPAAMQSPQEIERQRRIHDRLIEKGLQLISDSFLDRVERRCEAAGVRLRRQLLEGSNFEEIVKEANEGAGALPSLIGFDAAAARGYDGEPGAARADLALDASGRIEDPGPDAGDGPARAGHTGRRYDLVVMGAHGMGRQPRSELGGVAARVARRITLDLLLVRDERPLASGRFLVCVDGSAYAFHALRRALELAARFGASVHVCSAFDVEFHHVVFDNIKGVLSDRAARVFRFEEQEALHNHIIDRGLLRLCEGNLERALAIAAGYPGVQVETRVLIGKPFQVVLQWAEEVAPTLLVLARHGSHRIDGTDLGSQAENLLRLAPCSVLLTGVEGVRADDIPWIEADDHQGLEWTPEAEVRIQRVPPFAQAVARRAVEEHVAERGGDLVTRERLDAAIADLLPTHMQLIMGIGDAEELARAELKAEEQMARTLVLGSEADPEPAGAEVETRCPRTGRTGTRPRTVDDPPVWTREAFARLESVPLVARPLARRTVERFAAAHGAWRITTAIMDENRQAMIEAEEFDAETMMGMFRELRVRQIRTRAEAALDDPELRGLIEEARAAGVTRCPIRELEARGGECPIDFETVSPEEARAAVERLVREPPR